ncbi:MAG: hypothetical protein ACTHMP_05175, partial [Thermomicrobiales bacterium]
GVGLYYDGEVTIEYEPRRSKPTMTSLDRLCGFYGRPAYIIDYYEDGQIVSEGQPGRLIAVLHFPPESQLPTLPCGVLGALERKGLFGGKRVNYVAVNGAVIVSEHGEDLNAACNAARRRARGVGAMWMAGAGSRFLKPPPPFVPGRLQGSIRHYERVLSDDFTIQGWSLGGATLEAVIHLPSGRSIAILTQNIGVDYADLVMPCPEHAEYGTCLVQFMLDWEDIDLR